MVSLPGLCKEENDEGKERNMTYGRVRRRMSGEVRRCAEFNAADPYREIVGSCVYQEQNPQD